MIGWEHATRTVVAAAQPAAGASVTIPVPGSETQLLLAVCFRIVTSAAVASRTPLVTVLDGSGVALARVAAGFATTATTTVDYTFAHGLAEWDSAGTTIASGPAPLLPLEAGDQLVISVDAIDVGDQLSRVRVTLAQRAVRGD